MPSRHYRRHMLQKTASIPIYNINGGTGTGTGTNNEFLQYQKYIFEIMDLITTTLDISLITQKSNAFLQSIHTKLELYRITELIENNILSTIVNIAGGYDLGIIRCRIQYIRELISNIPDNSDDCNQYNYLNIYEQIFNLMDTLIKDLDFTEFINHMRQLKLYMADDIARCDTISLVESNILDIIKNIKYGYDIGIIRCRIIYVKELLSTIVV